MAEADISQYIDPNAYAQAQQAKQQANALAYAQMRPEERTAMAGYNFGGALGKAAGGLFGIKDRGLEEVTAANEIMKGVDRQDPKAMYEAAKVLGQQGYMKAGEAVFRQAQLLEERASKLAEQGAKTEYEKARAATAGIEKKSTADVAQMKDKIAQIEQDLADGKPISTKDLAYARAALVQLKQGKTYQDKEGRIIQVPGIDPNEFAPAVSAKVFGSAATPAQSAAAPANVAETQRLQGDKVALERELSRINPKEERYGIIKSELDKVNAKLSSSPAQAAQGTSTGGIKVIELPKSEASITAAADMATNRIKQVDETIKAAETALGQAGFWSTGFIGQVTQPIGGTPAHNLQATADTIIANLSFDRLQQMRDESKTGGALGSIAVRELELLGSTVAALKTSQTDTQLKSNLQKVIKHLQAYKEVQQKIANQRGTTGKPKINWEATVQNKMKQGYTKEQVEAALTSQGYTK